MSSLRDMSDDVLDDKLDMAERLMGRDLPRGYYRAIVEAFQKLFSERVRRDLEREKKGKVA